MKEDPPVTSAFHVYFGPDAVAAAPRVRRISGDDCFSALKEGIDDFFAMPTYPVFVGLFYAVAGIALFAMTSFGDALQLAFPLAAGFALIGPFVAIGLYEMSRRREHGLSVRGRDAFAVLRSPALPSILAFGLLLLAIFVAWIFAAELIYVSIYGPNPPATATAFFRDVLTTDRGGMLIVVGVLVGFCFAALALAISVISFPLMLDRDLGLVPALETSLRVTRANPLAVALWGLIVAVALVLGSLPLFFGLAVVMPVLGHATWRFYRKAIERDPAHEAPIEGPLDADVTRNPIVRFVCIFLDAIDVLREGKGPSDSNASNG
ncbi:MAG: DUF2189 domain-containing protein [Hyphomicrobiales bacterium]|nr:DUF2189 domain-containing protein [Hyphomicrobiales bacterium]